MSFILLLIGEMLMVLLTGIATVFIDVPAKMLKYSFLMMIWMSGAMNEVELKDFELEELDNDLLV